MAEQTEDASVGASDPVAVQLEERRRDRRFQALLREAIDQNERALERLGE